MFSNLVLFLNVVLSNSTSENPLNPSMLFHAIYPFSLSGHISSVHIFHDKIVLFPLKSFYCSVLVHSPHIVGKLLFFFICLVLIVLLDTVSVSFKPYFICPHLLINLHKSHCQTCLLICFGLFIPKYPNVFFSLCSFACCHNFFTGLSSLISYPDFVFLFGSFKRKLISLQTIFALT